MKMENYSVTKNFRDSAVVKAINTTSFHPYLILMREKGNSKCLLIEITNYVYLRT